MWLILASLYVILCFVKVLGTIAIVYPHFLLYFSHSSTGLLRRQRTLFCVVENIEGKGEKCEEFTRTNENYAWRYNAH